MPDASKEKRPPKPALSADAKDVLQACDAKILIRAIGQVEGLTALTLSDLANLGCGTRSGTILRECTTGVERAAARAEIANELMKADKALLVIAPSPDGKTTAREVSAKAVSRKVIAVVEASTAALNPVQKTTTDRADEGTKTVYTVAQNEDERAFSMQTFEMSDVKQGLAILLDMYNWRVRPSDLPTLGVFKKLAYWLKQNSSTADPARLKLTAYRRDPDESSSVLMRREISGIAIIMAGERADPELRDDGAGKTTRFGVQWAKGEVLQDMISEIEEARDKLSETELGNVCELIRTAMHKATGTASAPVTGSLAMVQQITKMTEHVAYARGRTMMSPTKTREKGQKSKGNKNATAPPASPSKRKGPAEEETSEKKRGRGTRPQRKPYIDAEGELGPNELPRMKGGNPKGDPCDKVPTARGCTFKFCSFSHE